MNSTTLERSPVGRTADPIAQSLTKAMTLLVSGLNALDKKLRERPARIGQHAAELLRLELEDNSVKDAREYSIRKLQQMGLLNRAGEPSSSVYSPTPFADVILRIIR